VPQQQASAARTNAGQSLVELATGLIILVPVILVLVDLAVIVTAVSVNDAVCRDAARVAAAGNPADPTLVKNRALQVIKEAYKAGGYIVGPELVGDPDIAKTKEPTAPYGGPYEGTVTVQTKIVVKVPASIPKLTPSEVELHSKQQFPITYVMPNTFNPL
jgi:hypothetical protein